MNCIEGDDGKCKMCGWTFPRPGVRRNCRVLGPTTVGETIARYAKAMARWIAAGRPTRTQEQIDAILTTHCGPCEHFTNGACGKCGCKVNRNPEAWRNKLAMGTEACPLDPPKWEAET